MIAKIGRGWDVRGLVGYLMGPGRSNEHTNPHVLGAWQSDPGALQPTLVGPGQFDFDSRELADLRQHVHAPAEAVGLPCRQPAEGEPGYTKHGYVWHASVSIGEPDGTLTDETWNAVARDVVEAAGIDSPDDPGGCRWIAVHHGASTEGNDHIHIAATLVRQDTGQRVHPKNDFAAVRKVMRRWEQKLGLTATGEPDRSAARQPSRAELEKTARRRATGMPAAERTNPDESVRGQLRQAVADTAATTGDESGFLSGLRERGVLVHLHRDKAGAVDGYAVALPGDVDAKGTPIFYGAGKHLSKDLGWRQLQNEWTRHGGTVADRPDKVTIDLTADAFRRAHTQVAHAREFLPTATAVEGRDIVVAAHRMVSAYSRVTEGNFPTGDAPRTRAAWSSHRCAASARLHRSTEPVSPIADALNAASRDLMILRFVSERGGAAAASLELAVSLSMLMVEIGEWAKRSGTPAVQRAAQQSADRLRTTGRTTHQTPSRAATATRTAPRTTARHSGVTPSPATPRRPLPPPHDQPKGPKR